MIATERSRWIALYVLCTGMLMIVLDVTVVNVALPYIQIDLGFSSSSLAWVVNAYLIAFGGLLLLAGRLGDLLGRRRIFLAGLTIFSIASMLCGVSSNGLMLVIFRFVQGVGGALTSAVILGVIVTMFPEPREQAKAIGVFAFVASAGGAVGLLAGGVLTQAINWHWIFFINVPIGIATAVLARRYISGDPGTGFARGVDVSGALLVTVALMLGVYTIVQPAAVDGWSSGTTLGFAAITIALFAGFIIREASATNPLMPLRIFRSRNVCGANIIQVLGAAGMFGTFFLGALYVQKVLHYDPMTIGFAFLPVSVLMGTVSVRYSERLIGRFGARSLCIAGLVLIAIALAYLGTAPVSGGYWVHIFPSLALIGLGAGMCFPPLMGLAMSGATPEDAGLASGLVNTTGQVGGALGLAVLATLTSTRTAQLSRDGHSVASALTGGYHLGFWISAALVLVGVVVAVVVLKAPVEQPGVDELLPVQAGEEADPVGAADMVHVMTSPADRTIDALRATHDELAAAVAGLSDDQLDAVSGASEWTVAQVLSHMGSGAEISLATLRAALDAAAGPGQDFNQGVWDRWNALSPREQADGFVASDSQLVATLEALSTEQRQSLTIDVGFFPAPLPLAAYLGMRLNEVGQHSWDVRVSIDPGAAIEADTAAVIAEHFATDLGFLLGFTGKADALAEPAVVDIHESGYAIGIADTVSITTSTPSATATFTGPLEAAVRLLGGRLSSQYTPAGLEVTGNLTLDDLRRVFPGY